MKTSVRRVTIGAPSDGGPEFALQIRPKRLDDPFAVRLPGVVFQVGKQRLLAILPLVAVVGPVADGAPVALVTFAETEPTTTDEALQTFVPALKKHPPNEFHLLVEAKGFTYRDLLESGKTGRFSLESPGAVALRMQLGLQGRKSPASSDAFPGLAILASNASDPGPSGDAGDSEGRHIWSCHSHWYAMGWPFPFGRYTLCHGPCTVGTCHCGPQGGNCKGWCICTC